MHMVSSLPSKGGSFVSWPVDITNSLPFSDAMHLTNFINYLYRTDRAQKWTCAETVGDAEFHADGSSWRFPADTDARRSHKLDVHRDIAHAVGAQYVDSIHVSPFENLVVYMPDDADPASVTAEFYELASEQNRWIIDLVILHVDQDGRKHLHVLGHLKPGHRRKPGETMTDTVFAPVF